VVAAPALDGNPVQAVDDPAHGYVYVLVDSASGSFVAVLEGSTVVANISVPDGSTQMSFDPAHGLVYVGDYGSDGGDSVAVINGTGLVGEVDTQYSPVEQVDDPAQGWDLSIDSYGYVTVINGTRAFTNLTAGDSAFAGVFDPVSGCWYVADTYGGLIREFNATTEQAEVDDGYGPDTLSVDPENGWVYAGDSYANTVTVVDGGSVLRTIGLKAGAGSITYDPTTGFMDVQLLGAPGRVEQLNGTQVVDVLSTGVSGWALGDLAYDPANGLVYVQDGASLLALNGTSWAGSVGLAGAFYQGYPMAYDPATGLLFVPEAAADVVAELSGTLALGAPLELAPVPGGAGRADVGQPVVVASPVRGVGTGTLSPSGGTPAAGPLGCGPPTMEANATPIELVVDCDPSGPGEGAVWLNLSDAVGTVSAWIDLTVDPDPVATAPVATVDGRSNATAADVGQSVAIAERPNGGAGNYTSYNWTGIPAWANCTGNGTSVLTCTFPDAATVSLEVTVTDQAGLVAGPSPVLTLRVNLRPSDAAPLASRPSADVGQLVNFTAATTWGTRPYRSFDWTGLSAGTCAGLTSATVRCTFGAPQTLSVGVSTVDATGAASPPSPTTELTVFALPTVGVPTASRSTADSGQAVNFTVSGGGGSGGVAFDWYGLPGSCAQASTDAPRCLTGAPGNYTVTVRTMDTDRGLSNLSDGLAVAVYPDVEVEAPTVSEATVTVGGNVTVATEATGGYGELELQWSGLPPGCAGAGATVACRPAAAGNYEISVTVTDANGYRALSTQVGLAVVLPPAPAPVPRLFGLPLPELVVLVLAAAVAAGLGIAVLVRHRHR
jgi:hypothetical protein